MLSTAEGVRSLSDLRTFVHETLCHHENLLRDQFPLSEIRLRRGGSDCGIQFSLHGPRSVCLSAVWAADQNVVYFYDTRGERFRKVPLRHRPLAAEAEAA